MGSNRGLILEDVGQRNRGYRGSSRGKYKMSGSDAARPVRANYRAMTDFHDMMLCDLRQLVNETSIENQFKLITQICSTYTGADYTSLRVKDQATGEYVIKAHLGDAKLACKEQCRYISRTGKFILSNEDSCVCTRLINRGSKTGLASILCLPFVAKNELYSVLSITKTGAKARFTPGEVDFMKMITRWSGLVIEKEGLTTLCRTQRLQLNRIIHQISRAQENERRKVANELHDSIGQGMISVTYGIRACKALFLESRFDELESELNKVENTLQTGIKDIRRVLANIRPLQLEKLGLAGALRQAAERLAADGVECHIDIDDSLPKLSSDEETTVYWVVQEALTNIRKHARSTGVRLGVKHDDHILLVKISDNGRGFSPDDVMHSEATLEHMGLLGIKDRIEVMGGWINIDSRPGNGTAISFGVPIMSGITTAAEVRNENIT